MNAGCAYKQSRYPSRMPKQVSRGHRASKDRRLLYLLGGASIAGGIAYFRARRKNTPRPTLDGILAAVQEATQSQMAVETLPGELRTLLSSAGEEAARLFAVTDLEPSHPQGPVKEVLVRDAEFEIIKEKRR